MAILDRDILKTIVSINVFDNEMKTQCIGTGFIVGYPSEPGKSDEYYTFLITNKHVVEDIESFHYGLHKRDNSVLQMIVNISDFKSKGLMKWHNHEDVDIVAVVVDQLHDLNLSAEFRSYPLEKGGLNCELLIRENICEGREIYTAGYPLGFVEEDNVLPIVRHGVISRISGQYTKDRDVKEFLIDAFSFPGSSGSPVYTAIDPHEHKNQTKLIDNNLIGILNGSFNYIDELVSKQTNTTMMITKDNTGLTNVFMVDHIFETIELFDHIKNYIPRK